MPLLRSLRRLKRRYLTPSYAKQKLLRGVERLARLGDDEVRSYDAVVDVIRQVGLKYDPRGLYGAESKWMNPTADGLWQLPPQLAGALLVLANQPIRSFLEVGTNSGFTGTIITAYLHRLDPSLRAVTIDPYPSFRYYDAVREALPLEYRQCTTSELGGETYDCVLIDGDHSYEAVKQDYEIVGRKARVCLFHDINDDLSGFDNVPRLWRELVDSGEFDETHELLDSPPGKRVMGIGVGIRRAA